MNPRKLTPELIGQLVPYRRESYSLQDAIDMAGISPTSYFAWQSRGKKEKEGPCRALYDAMQQVKADIARRRKERKQAVLERKIENLKRKFNEQHHIA